MQWTLTTLIQHITSLIALTIPIAVGLCIVAFMWGLFQVLTELENAEKRKEGSKKMIWGILALFIVLSLGGVVRILEGTLLGQ